MMKEKDSEINYVFYDTPDNTPIEPPTNGISLLAFQPLTSDKEISTSLCAELKDCGFNVIFANISDNVIQNSLTNCEANGLKLFISNANLTYPGHLDYCKNTVNRFKDKAGLAGWVLRSPISFSEMDSILEYYNTILLNDTTVNGLSHPIFISLDASPDSSYLDGKKLYEYIQDFQQKFKPGFWPFICYPLLMKNNAVVGNYDNYYTALEIFSMISRYTSTPFWAFCSCQRKVSYNGDSFPVPTLESIRYTVFTALAYGAQGICYTYYRQTSSSNASDAPVDTSGNKTKTWDYVKTVNDEVKAFDSVFFGCRLLDCRYFINGLEENVSGKADDVIPETYKELMYGYTKPFYFPMGPLQEVDAPIPGVIISHLNNSGVDYLVIVNRSALDKMTLKLKFNSYYKVYRIQKSGSTISKTQILSYDTMNIEMLPAGGYMIFSWE